MCQERGVVLKGVIYRVPLSLSEEVLRNQKADGKVADVNGLMSNRSGKKRRKTYSGNNCKF